MDEELEYITRDGYVFCTNLWASFDGGPPERRHYLVSEVWWAARTFSKKWIYFVWDGKTPEEPPAFDLKIDWDMDADLPLYTRDWLRDGFIIGYRIDGKLYHPDDVEILKNVVDPAFKRPKQRP